MVRNVAVIDWAVYVPIIAQIVGPKVLDLISSLLKLTQESERERLSGMLGEISDEVYRIAHDVDKKKKGEIVEKIQALMEKLDSQECQQTLRPNVAEVVMHSLQHAPNRNKSVTAETLTQLRKLLNTWKHDVDFSGRVPTVNS